MASLFDVHLSNLFNDNEFIRNELILHRAMFIAAEKYRVGRLTLDEYRDLIDEYDKETSKLINYIFKEKK